MAKQITTDAKFIKLLVRPEGATSEELRVAMNRVWGPSQYQLMPIADRLGYEYSWSKEEGEPTRYHFSAKARAAVKKVAVSTMKRGARKTA
jgi:hypothetical protein